MSRNCMPSVYIYLIVSTSESETSNQSGEINVTLKTPSSHGKHSECGAKEWQH